MNTRTEQARREGGSGLPVEVTEESYRRAVARAEAFLLRAHALSERVNVAQEQSTARLMSAERTLRIARQVLARIHMLRRGLDRN